MQGDTLVLVHVSSLDTLSWLKGECVAYELAERFLLASTHYESMIVMDQQWAEESQARNYLYSQLENYNHVQFLIHDEDIHEWKDALDQLYSIIGDRTKIDIGGLWLSDNQEDGCVNMVKQYLQRKGVDCAINPFLCADQHEGINHV